MRVTIIHGSTRRGSTWHCVNLLTKELAELGDMNVSEFFLPTALPHFCHGCFSCFMHGEQSCPHAEYTAPIVSAMEEADLLILTSPVYGLDVSGQLKAFLDHLCFMWFSHRPNPKMFNKVGLTVTTTAGAGLSHTTKTMKNNLIFWGVKKVFTYKKAVAAAKWNEIKPKKAAQIQKEVKRLAKQIHRSVDQAEKLPKPLFRKLLFWAMSGMMKKNTWSPVDKAHWEKQGWLSGNKPV